MSSRPVSIADLKDNLSSYLGMVRRGEELVIRDRTQPIAMIIPLSGMRDFGLEEAVLVAEGKLRPAKGPLPARFWKTRAPRVSADDLLKVLRADRDED